MEKTIERLVNGNIKVTIPIRLKYDGCKTVIHQPEAEPAELDPETMSPLQKAVIQGFQYRDMLESGKVATIMINFTFFNRTGKIIPVRVIGIETVFRIRKWNIC